MAPSMRYGAMEPENQAAAQSYQHQRDDGEDPERYSELSSLLTEETSCAGPRGNWGWLRSSRVRVGLLGVMMVSALLAVSFNHGLRGSRKAVVTSTAGTKTSLMTVAAKKKKGVARRKHKSKFHFSSLDTSVDGETTLSVYGRLYKNETDCSDQTVSYPDSDWSLSLTSGVCTTMVLSGEDDGTDASYMMLTCDDDVMMLYYYLDSDCTLYDSSFMYNANEATCVEGVDDDSYMRVYASSCDGTVDETNNFFQYNYSPKEERKYAISYIYEKQGFLHQQLHRMGYEVTQRGYEYAATMAPKFRKALDNVLKMYKGDDDDRSKAIQQDLIDSFTDPVVFQYILDYWPKRGVTTVSKSNAIAKRNKGSKSKSKSKSKSGTKAKGRGRSAHKAAKVQGGPKRQLFSYSPDGQTRRMYTEEHNSNFLNEYRPEDFSPVVLQQNPDNLPTPSIAPVHRVLASSPTKTPTIAPTKTPTIAPTKAPTIAPTYAPTKGPTKAPTKAPTRAPTPAPTSDYSSWGTVCAYVGVSFSLLFWTGSYSISLCADDDDSGFFYSYCYGDLIGCEISVTLSVGASYVDGALADVPGRGVAIGKSIDVSAVSVSYEAGYGVDDDFDDDDLDDFSVTDLVPDDVSIGVEVSAGEGVSYFETSICEGESYDDDDQDYFDDDDWESYLTDDAVSVTKGGAMRKRNVRQHPQSKAKAAKAHAKAAVASTHHRASP